MRAALEPPGPSRVRSAVDHLQSARIHRASVQVDQIQGAIGGAVAIRRRPRTPRGVRQVARRIQMHRETKARLPRHGHVRCDVRVCPARSSHAVFERCENAVRDMAVLMAPVCQIDSASPVRPPTLYSTPNVSRGVMSTETVVQSDPLKRTAMSIRQVFASCRRVAAPVRRNVNFPYGRLMDSSIVATRSSVTALKIRSRSRVARAVPSRRISRATPPLMIHVWLESSNTAAIAM